MSSKKAFLLSMAMILFTTAAGAAENDNVDHHPARQHLSWDDEREQRVSEILREKARAEGERAPASTQTSSGTSNSEPSN